MSISTPHDFQPLETVAALPTDHRGKISLANLAFEIPTNPHPNDPQSALPKKPISKITTWVLWSIFNLVLVPLGIVCCYFSYRVSQLKRQNRYEKASRWSRTTLILNIITTLLMLGVIVAAVMLRYDYRQRNLNLEFNQNRTAGTFIPWQPGR